MKQEKPSADSFGTFLEGLRRRRAKQGALETAANVPMQLLRVLWQSGPQPVTDLMTKAELGFTEFAEALTVIRDAGLVSVTPGSKGEEVRLTPSGEQVAQLNT